MTDPFQELANAAVSAAIGAVAKEVISPGVSWVRGRFGKQSNIAKREAASNVDDFLHELVPRIQALEDSSQELKKRVDTVATHPDFIVLMQRTFESAAQTNRHEKHVLLAELVSARLQVTDEDMTIARTCDIACEAIAHLTSKQIKLLGLLYTLNHMQFIPPHQDMGEELIRSLELSWVDAVLGPYSDVHCTPLDRMHLDSVGCLSAQHGMILSHSLQSRIASATSPEFLYDQFRQTPLGIWLFETYEGQRQ